MAEEVRPKDVEAFQLRKRHLFNECNNDKVFPLTYAKTVMYVNDQGEEVDLQTYLENLMPEIDVEDIERSIDTLETDVASLKTRMDAAERAIDVLNANVQAICDFLHISLTYREAQDDSRWTANGDAWKDNGVAYFKSASQESTGSGLFAADNIWVDVNGDNNDAVGVLKANKFLEETRS